MAISRDFLLDEDDDLFFDPNTGDMAIGESDTQHVKDIINSWAGWWKQFPTLGAGIRRKLGSPGSIQRSKRLIQIHLKSDNYRTDKVSIIAEKVYVTGERIK